jgi:hypothetical protein
MAVVISNTNRIRATSDSTQADALNKVADYVTANGPTGNKVPRPTASSHPIKPT